MKLLFAEQIMSAKADAASMCGVLDHPGKVCLYSSLFAALQLHYHLEIFVHIFPLTLECPGLLNQMQNFKVLWKKSEVFRCYV